MNNDCIFCKIITGVIPAQKIYEDDKVFAFLDINPVNPGHTLVIPKEHFKNIMETPPEILCNLVKVVQKIAPAIVKATDSEGFNVGINTGSSAGQVIFHTHIHVMPRRSDDGRALWKGKEYGEGEIEETAEKIKTAIG
ncbi:MAG: HIT family protein [bacterium]|nr:HIT family protein [bacterium]